MKIVYNCGCSVLFEIDNQRDWDKPDFKHTLGHIFFCKGHEDIATELFIQTTIVVGEDYKEVSPEKNTRLVEENVLKKYIGKESSETE